MNDELANTKACKGNTSKFSIIVVQQDMDASLAARLLKECNGILMMAVSVSWDGQWQTRRTSC